MDFKIDTWKDALQHPRLRMEIVSMTIAMEHKKGKAIFKSKAKVHQGKKEQFIILSPGTKKDKD